MDRFELVNEILGLCPNDYKYGVVTVSANNRTVELLKEYDIMESKNGAPTVEECCEFVRKYESKSAELRLTVINPEREDFRIEIEGITIGAEYAKVSTMEDIKFWKEFMDLGKKGQAYMDESEEEITWHWSNI